MLKSTTGLSPRRLSTSNMSEVRFCSALNVIPLTGFYRGAQYQPGRAEGTFVRRLVEGRGLFPCRSFTLCARTRQLTRFSLSLEFDHVVQIHRHRDRQRRPA
ncbi:hypothetical protein EMIT053CA3_270058 [Pseudomonas donghuensis]